MSGFSVLSFPSSLLLKTGLSSVICRMVGTTAKKRDVNKLLALNLMPVKSLVYAFRCPHPCTPTRALFWNTRLGFRANKFEVHGNRPLMIRPS